MVHYLLKIEGVWLVVFKKKKKKKGSDNHLSVLPTMKLRVSEFMSVCVYVRDLVDLGSLKREDKSLGLILQAVLIEAFLHPFPNIPPSHFPYLPYWCPPPHPPPPPEGSV